MRFSSARSYITLSIGAAVLTMALKFVAFAVTGSVGLLSDALESVVNLVAALIAFWALTLAARPADEEHTYGHSKVEYFASGIEGGLIVLAAFSIAIAAVPRSSTPIHWSRWAWACWLRSSRRPSMAVSRWCWGRRASG